MISPEKKIVQKMISYRAGDKTSSISIQPAIYEALLLKFNSDTKKCNSLATSFALEAIKLKISSISLYVQSELLLSLMPPHIQKHEKFINSTHNRLEVRYKSPINNCKTKLTTLSVIKDLLDIAFDGKGEAIHQNMAKQIIISRKDVTEEESKKCCISHLVRERIILNLVAILCPQI